MQNRSLGPKIDQKAIKVRSRASKGNFFSFLEAKIAILEAKMTILEAKRGQKGGESIYDVIFRARLAECARP